MNDEVVKQIESFIINNGTLFRMAFNCSGNVIPVSQVSIVKAKEQKGTLFTYIKSFVDSYKGAQNVVVTVKKSNGSTSAGRNPIAETFTLKNPYAMNGIPQVPTNIPGNGVGGLGQVKTYGLDGGAALQLELMQQRNDELTNSLRELNVKYSKKKKAYNALKIDHATQEARHNWEIKALEHNEKNSMAGVASEVMPHLKELAEDYFKMKKLGGETPALEGVTDSRISEIIEMFKELEDENQIKFYHECLARIAGMESDQLLPFMKHLRSLTPSVTID